MDVQLIENVVLIFHVLAALGIIGLVLLQHGKGADMGSGFGGGSSSTVFGAGGAGNFLTRMTTTIAIVFFVTSFALAYFAKERSVSVTEVGVPLIEQVLELPDPAVIPDTPAADVIDGDVPTLE